MYNKHLPQEKKKSSAISQQSETKAGICSLSLPAVQAYAKSLPDRSDKTVQKTKLPSRGENKNFRVGVGYLSLPIDTGLQKQTTDGKSNLIQLVLKLPTHPYGLSFKVGPGTPGEDTVTPGIVNQIVSRKVKEDDDEDRSDAKAELKSAIRDLDTSLANRKKELEAAATTPQNESIRKAHELRIEKETKWRNALQEKLDDLDKPKKEAWKSIFAKSGAIAVTDPTPTMASNSHLPKGSWASAISNSLFSNTPSNSGSAAAAQSDTKNSSKKL